MSTVKPSGVGTLTESLSNMRDLVAVDLPCLLKSYKKGIDMCGGNENIKNTIKNKSSLLQIQLNSKADPLRHRIVGQKEKSVCLLLKLTRSKSTLVKAEIIGRTSESYCFNQCADYQFLSAVPTPACRTIVNYSTGLMVQGSSNETVIETIPRPFAKSVIVKLQKSVFQDRQDTKQSIGQQINTTQVNGNDEQDYLQKRRDRKLAAKAQYSSYLPLVFRKVGDPVPPYINYSVITKANDPSTTTANTATEINNNNNNNNNTLIENNDPKSAIDLTRTRKRNLYRKKVTLAALERIFSQIPILARRHLRLHPHLQKNAYMILEFIPKLTYCYRDGAYKGLLVRRGFDPEAYENRDEARFYQLLTIRVPLTTFKLIQQRVWISLGRLSSYKRVNLDTLTVHDEASAMNNMTMTTGNQHTSTIMNDNNSINGSGGIGGDDMSGSGNNNADKDSKSVYSSSSAYTQYSTSTATAHHNPSVCGRKSSDDYVTLSIFGAIIKRQFSIQLCSIKDESLMNFIRSVHPQQYFSDSYGWFSAAALALMREKLMKILLARVDAFVLSINTANNATANNSGSISNSSSSNSSAVTAGTSGMNLNASGYRSTIPPKASSSSSVVSNYDHDDDEDDLDNDDTNNNHKTNALQQTPEDILDPYRWASRYVNKTSSSNSSSSSSSGTFASSNASVSGSSSSTRARSLRNDGSSDAVSVSGRERMNEPGAQDVSESNYGYDDNSTSASTTITRQTFPPPHHHHHHQSQEVIVPEEDEMEYYINTKQRDIKNFKKRSRNQLKNQLIYSSLAVAAGESGGTAFGISLNPSVINSATPTTTPTAMTDMMNFGSGSMNISSSGAGILDFNRVNTAHISHTSGGSRGRSSGASGTSGRSGDGKFKSKSVTHNHNIDNSTINNHNNNDSSSSSSSNNSSSTSTSSNNNNNSDANNIHNHPKQQQQQLGSGTGSVYATGTANEVMIEDELDNTDDLQNDDDDDDDDEEEEEGENDDEEEDDDDDYVQASIDSAAIAAVSLHQDVIVNNHNHNHNDDDSDSEEDEDDDAD